MAVGDRTETRLVGPSGITTSNTALGTVAAARVWVVKQIILCNTNGVVANVTLAVGTAVTVTNQFLATTPIGAYDTLVLDTALVLTATETISGLADRTGVNIIVTGWLKEV